MKMITFKYRLLFVCMFMLFKFHLFSQTQDLTSSFILEGQIDRDTGNIKLYAQSFPSCYPFELREQNAKIKNGHFAFSGSISYPMAVILKLNGDYLSGTFFIEPGKQSVRCHMDSVREIPHILNKSMNEYQNLFLPGFEALKSTVESFETLRAEKAKYVFNYSYAHPNSYIAYWSIADQLSRRNNPALLNNAFNHLTPSIQNSYSGNALKELLQGAKSTEISSTFPALELVDSNQRSVIVPVLSPNIKFTLIDFWFHKCGPCIEQFPDLKRLFDIYQGSGLNIVGISVDKEEFIPAWKRVIEEHQVNWPQYLDLDSKKAKELAISYFPTNFLLDKSGKIIAKDISMKELTTFLSDNL